ncbi:MAG: hypothetical protein ACFHX7_17340 [Pseudomonadota bacterium]
MKRITQYLTSMALQFILLAATPGAQAVLLDGKEWMQLTETVNFHYNNMASACDVTTGNCQGTVTNHLGKTLDLTGWTWASQRDVASLFYAVTGAPAGTYDLEVADYATSTGVDSWAEAFIDKDGEQGPDTGYFYATAENSPGNFWVAGYTRTVLQDGRVDRSWILSSPTSNRSVIGNPNPPDAARSHTAVWLYQTQAVGVPAPASLVLLLVGMAFIGMQRHSTVIRIQQAT